MRTDGRHLVAALALALAVFPAAAFQQLDGRQRELLAPLADAWSELDEPTRAGLRTNAAHWLGLTPDQQKALVARMHAWDASPASERARARAPFAAWQALPDDEKAQLRQLAKRVAALPEAERQVLRAAFDALPSDERQEWWLGPRLGADFAGLRPLFAFVPEGERPPLLALLRTLSPQARANLAELAKRLPADQREVLRRELVAATPADREALIRDRLGYR
jgi:hypothetical protein